MLLRGVGLSTSLALALGGLSGSLQVGNAESNMQSVMGIINTDETVTLDPSVQHIPLDPSLAHLRPPPAKVSAAYDIFVGLSVFRDSYRCGKTIFTGFKRAKHPERLYFGVVDQVNPGDGECIIEYCKMANAEWPDKECAYKDQIKIDKRTADDSRGPTLARHYQQKLVGNQEFCLQLDGHSIFTNLWDVYIVDEWKRIDNEMAVLTTYLHHIHDFVKENGDNNVPTSLPHLCTTIRGGNGCVRNEGASMISDSKFPQLSALWGAGLSFSKCHAEKRVLIDSHTLWMFDGEEFLRASHLWTHGYDLYSPSHLGSVVYHNYSKVPARFEHVKVDAAQRELEDEMGKNRFFLIVGKPFKGRVDTFEMDQFAFGTVRSFQQYLNFSGVTFEEGQTDKNSCYQLHWVPYANPKEIEEIVGNGWKLYPATSKPVPIELPKPVSRTPKPVGDDTAPTKTLGKDEEKAGGAGTGEDNQVIHKGNAVVINQQQLRSDPQQQNMGPNGATIFVLLCLVVVLLFAYSNDDVWRAVTRTFRPKRGHMSV